MYAGQRHLMDASVSRIDNYIDQHERRLTLAVIRSKEKAGEEDVLTKGYRGKKVGGIKM